MASPFTLLQSRPTSEGYLHALLVLQLLSWSIISY